MPLLTKPGSMVTKHNRFSPIKPHDPYVVLRRHVRT